MSKSTEYEIEQRARKISREYTGDEDCWPTFVSEAQDELDEHCKDCGLLKEVCECDL